MVDEDQQSDKKKGPNRKEKPGGWPSGTQPPKMFPSKDLIRRQETQCKWARASQQADVQLLPSASQSGSNSTPVQAQEEKAQKAVIKLPATQ